MIDPSTHYPTRLYTPAQAREILAAARLMSRDWWTDTFLGPFDLEGAALRLARNGHPFARTASVNALLGTPWAYFGSAGDSQLALSIVREILARHAAA